MCGISRKSAQEWKRGDLVATIQEYAANWRKVNGLTQRQIAEKVDREAKAVSEFEAGKRKSLALLLGYILCGMDIDSKQIERGDAGD